MLRRPKATDITIAVFQGKTGLDALRSTWDNVVSGMTHRRFFHLWEWYYSYLKCLEPPHNTLMFFLITKGKIPVAILPLHFDRISLGGLQLKALTFPSHDHLLLCDFICHRDALTLPLFDILSQYLRNQRKIWDVIQLPHLLKDACAVKVIEKYPSARFLLCHENYCDFMDTTGKYASFVSELSRNFKRSLKRARQCLDRLPGVRFASTHNGPELEEHLDAFMNVEASGWKGSLGTGTAIKLHPDLRCFYRQLISTLSASERVSINTLTADGKCIAAQFCLLVDDTAYLLKIGHDEAYNRCAPGKLLLDFFIKRSMEDCAIQNINYVTDSEWHKDWKPQTHDKFTLYLFNVSPIGLIGFVILKSYLILKANYQTYIKHRLSKRIRERIGVFFHEKFSDPSNELRMK